MNYFRINGINYEVVVTGIVETFNILYSENTGRVISTGAQMELDPLGTFIGHKVTIKRKRGIAPYCLFLKTLFLLGAPKYILEVAHSLFLKDGMFLANINCVFVGIIFATFS